MKKNTKLDGKIMKIVNGGTNVYGYDIGILMLDSKFPRIPGDVGNAKTWDFPVLYKKVVGGTPQKVVLELKKKDIQPFIDAAIELQKEGVKAITTSCGFLAMFQNELAEAVDIPVFTSALLLVPMVSKMIGKKSKVGILTANKKTLSNEHLCSVGIDPSRCVIEGLEDKKVFTNFTVQNWDTVDVDLCKEELIESALKLVNEQTDVEAIVLECTNMPPFAKSIQEAIGKPVFDIVTLTKMVYTSLNQLNY